MKRLSTPGLNLDTIISSVNSCTSKLVVNVFVKSCNDYIDVKIDTGAEVNVMPIEVVKALGVKSLKSTKQVLTGYSGDAIPLLGRVDL